jgi:hypothetical protein
MDAFAPVAAVECQPSRLQDASGCWRGKLISLAGSEDSWIEGGSGVERLVYFSDAVLAICISFFSTAAAGYSVLLLFFVRPITALYARRRPG